MTSQSYLIIILIIIFADYFLSTLSDALNLKASSTALPGEFKDVFDADKYAKSQRYLKDNTVFGFIDSAFALLVLMVFIFGGVFNKIDLFARSFGFGSIVTGIIFVVAYMLINKIINLPFSVYDTFVIEKKYGFSKVTPKIFISDMAKGLLLGGVLAAAALAVFVWFFERYAVWGWLYAWAALSILQLLLSYIAPVIIMPIFNKFTELEDGELKDSLTNYAKSQNFKMKGLFKMDGSRRSTKGNAYFTGFGKYRRIVLYDTLIEKLTVPELTAVLAHEMGHFKKGHIKKTLIVAFAESFVMFYLFSLFLNNGSLTGAFGFDHVSVYASLIVFSFLYSPVSDVLGIIMNKVSRKHEYEADKFSAVTYNNPQALIDGLKKLSADSLSNLTPHKLKVILEYSHPPLLERIKYIRTFIK